MTQRDVREEMIHTALRMNALGINQGKAGNISARLGSGFLVTPTGLHYEDTTPQDLVFMGFEGQRAGKRAPSSEWQMHRDILLSRTEMSAIVHCHPAHATALACLGMEIPAFHYMVAVAGGSNIRCAPYATFGTEQLSFNALFALRGRRACLLANHGIVALGETLADALDLALEVETLAGQYWRALQVGKPNILPEKEMAIVIEKFKTYGQPQDES